MQVKHWPNTQALARRLASEFHNPGLEQQLMAHASPCVQPGFMAHASTCVQPGFMAHASPCVQPGFIYFENKFWNELLHLVTAFKATRLFHPGKVVDLRPDATTVLDLKAFHFLQEAIPNLQKELPTYLAAAEDVSVNVEVMEW